MLLIGWFRLAGLNWVCALAYLDDVVLSNTLEEHLAHLEALFTRCAAARLHLSPMKSALRRKATLYLGFIVPADGVRPDPRKTDPIRRFPQPTDRRMVRRLLGIGSYYRGFIRNFARLADPLQRLVPERATFTWGREQQEAFEAVKAAFINATEMMHPRSGFPFVIDCDAAIQGLGAVLQQRDD